MPAWRSASTFLCLSQCKVLLQLPHDLGWSCIATQSRSTCLCIFVVGYFDLFVQAPWSKFACKDKRLILSKSSNNLKPALPHFLTCACSKL